AAVDRIAARTRWRAVRAAHRLSVEGGPSGVCLGVDGAPAIPAVGGARLLGGDVAPAAAIVAAFRHHVGGGAGSWSTYPAPPAAAETVRWLLRILLASFHVSRMIP